MRQEILTGVERHRHWSMGDKRRIVTGVEAEGISVAELARRHDVTRQQIYQWRSELHSKGLLPATPSKFVSVELTFAVLTQILLCRVNIMSRSAYGMAAVYESRPTCPMPSFIA